MKNSYKRRDIVQCNVKMDHLSYINHYPIINFIVVLPNSIHISIYVINLDFTYLHNLHAM